MTARTLAVILAAACATPALAFTLPDMQLPELRSIADGSLVNPNSFQLQANTNGAIAVGVTTMRVNHPEITGAGQTVVVIDTGIDYNHPALSANYLTGYNFITNTSDPFDNYAVTGGHGTHVAGIIASTDPTRPGIAPGAKIISLKVFDSTGNGSDANLLAALNWVALNKATYNITTVNMSLGDGVENSWSSIAANDPYDVALHGLKQMGVFVTVASGNEAFLHGQSMPAASRNAVSVGATYVSSDWSGFSVSGIIDPYQNARLLDNAPVKDDIAFFSNRYKTPADGSTSLLAPGIFINSTVPVALDNDGIPDGWGLKAGTSMASPQVAGASMLVRQALEEANLLDPDPAHQVDQILAILQDTGVPLYDTFWLLGGDNSTLMEIPPGSNSYSIPRGSNQTYDRIDLNAAITSILGAPEPTTLTLLLPSFALLLARRMRSRL